MELALIGEILIGIAVGLTSILYGINRQVHKEIKNIKSNKPESYYSVVLKGKQDIIVLAHVDTYNFLKRFNKENNYVWYVAFQIKGEDVLLVERTSIKDLFYVTPHSCNCEACQQNGNKKVRIL